MRLHSQSTLLDILQDRLLGGYLYVVLTLGFGTTSPSSAAVRSETRGCAPILPTCMSRLPQPNNIVLTLLADLHDVLGLPNTVFDVDGPYTDV